MTQPQIPQDERQLVAALTEVLRQQRRALVNTGTEGGGGITRVGDDCLLMIAAYDQGAAGDFMKMRNMLQDVATKSNAPAREIRSIWFLNKSGKITPQEYELALRFLAAGAIMQAPGEF